MSQPVKGNMRIRSYIRMGLSELVRDIKKYRAKQIIENIWNKLESRIITIPFDKLN